MVFYYGKLVHERYLLAHHLEVQMYKDPSGVMENFQLLERFLEFLQEIPFFYYSCFEYFKLVFLIFSYFFGD